MGSIQLVPNVLVMRGGFHQFCDTPLYSIVLALRWGGVKIAVFGVTYLLDAPLQHLEIHYFLAACGFFFLRSHEPLIKAIRGREGWVQGSIFDVALKWKSMPLFTKLKNVDPLWFWMLQSNSFVKIKFLLITFLLFHIYLVLDKWLPSHYKYHRYNIDISPWLTLALRLPERRSEYLESLNVLETRNFRKIVRKSSARRI